MKRVNFCSSLTLIPLNTTTCIVKLIFSLLADHIILIGHEIGGKTSRFGNIWHQIQQIRVIFTHLKLWVALASHNFR